MPAELQAIYDAVENGNGPTGDAFWAAIKATDWWQTQIVDVPVLDNIVARMKAGEKIVFRGVTLTEEIPPWPGVQEDRDGDGLYDPPFEKQDPNTPWRHYIRPACTYDQFVEASDEYNFSSPAYFFDCDVFSYPIKYKVGMWQPHGKTNSVTLDLLHQGWSVITSITPDGNPLMIYNGEERTVQGVDIGWCNVRPAIDSDWKLGVHYS